jgi:hypothetical protein
LEIGFSENRRCAAELVFPTLFKFLARSTPSASEAARPLRRRITIEPGDHNATGILKCPENISLKQNIRTRSETIR